MTDFKSIVILAVVIIVVILLQVFLSKREPWWPGLVLPFASLLVSVLFVMNMVIPPDTGTGAFAVTSGMAFLLYNIGTLILLAIYFACRGKKRKKRQLEKMNIQDL